MNKRKIHSSLGSAPFAFPIFCFHPVQRPVYILPAEKFRGARVLLRSDLNVPLTERTQAILDERRILQSLPTIR